MKKFLKLTLFSMIIGGLIGYILPESYVNELKGDAIRFASKGIYIGKYRIYAGQEQSK